MLYHNLNVQLLGNNYTLETYLIHKKILMLFCNISDSWKHNQYYLVTCLTRIKNNVVI